MYRIAVHSYRCVLNERFIGSFLPEIRVTCKHIVCDNKKIKSIPAECFMAEDQSLCMLVINIP